MTPLAKEKLILEVQCIRVRASQEADRSGTIKLDVICLDRRVPRVYDPSRNSAASSFSTAGTPRKSS